MAPFDFVLAGRYRLIAPLGEGGMATVYRGRDLRLNRDVAIKVLREDLTSDLDFLNRFHREAQIVASLSHPNIVPVYDVGEEGGTHFIVMEYIRGRTLKDELSRHGPLPPSTVSTLLHGVLDALGYAHTQGLVHRDVKPQNILLSPDGTPRLADFGIAHLADGSTTRTAAILGSAHYLSPEQARGEDATVRSDVYACGIVLYEMLEGRPPYDGTNALAIATQHLTAPPPPLSSQRDPAHGQLQAVIFRALSKDPALRFSDTSDFSRALILAVPSADETVMVPLAEATQEVVLSSGAHPLVSAAVSGLTLRRSTRKPSALALLAFLSLAAAAYVASQGVAGRTLPQYPSPPYALLPAFIVAALALSWFRARAWVYRMDGNSAVVQWGLVAHRRFGVPVRSITTLELKQSPIDRLLGVGTVELCARDQHGRERRVVMEDLRHPRETYEDLMHLIGRAGRVRVPTPRPESHGSPQ